MGDIKKRVDDSKAGKLGPKEVIKDNSQIEVNWGNAEKIKILLLQAINNNLVELVKLMKDVKSEDK